MPRVIKDNTKRDVAYNLIEKMNGIKTHITGTMLITDLFRLIPDIPENIINQIAIRNNINFNNGILKNVYTEEMKLQLKIENEDYDLILPQTISGNYVCYTDNFRITFDNGNTIKIGIDMGWLGYHTTDLLKIDVSRQRAFIDWDNNKADTLIEWDMPA